MDRGLNCFVELFIKGEVDIELHLLEILIHLFVDEGKILLDDLCLDSTIFEEIIGKVIVGNIFSLFLTPHRYFVGSL